MNKSEIELQNITDIINEMEPAERELCRAMVASLLASIGNPIHGKTFMLAVAFANCEVAVHNIKMGLVNSDGSIPSKFMQGDGKAFGGVKAEVISFDEMAPHAAMVAEQTVLQNATPVVTEMFAKGGIVGSNKQFILQPGGSVEIGALSKPEVAPIDVTVTIANIGCPVEEGIKAMDKASAKPGKFEA